MGVSQSHAASLAEWRTTLVRAYLSLICAVIPVVFIAWMVLRPTPSLDVPAGFIIGSWVLFLGSRFLAPASIQAATLVASMMVVAVAGPLTIGLSAGPLMSGVTGVLMASFLFGRRTGLVLLGLWVACYAAVGTLYLSGTVTLIDPAVTDPRLPSNWVRVIIVTVLSTALLQVLLTGLFQRMQEGWREAVAAAERERAEQEQRLEAEKRTVVAQRQEAVGRLAGGVAHDFNNLLVIILSWTDIIPRAKSEADRTEGLAAIRNAAWQAAQLTRQLVSFAKQDVQRPTAMDLDGFVAAMLPSLRRVLAANVTFGHVPSPGLPRVLADETQVGQVLVNLVTNAGDAMPQGGSLTLRCFVVEPTGSPSDVPPARYVAVSVTDSGVGMDEATRKRVFEPFFTTKGQGRGTGLGLASVAGIATQSGGWVRVESEPGKGSTFTVAFPLAPEGARVAVAASSPGVVPAQRASRILIVDDDAAVRRAMAMALERAGYEPVEAGNADEALTLARRHGVELELLCTDGVMPGLPTHVLIDGFRQMFPQAPVLLCSGHIEEDLLRRGISEGKVAMLPKPFNADALVGKVRELLASKA